MTSNRSRETFEQQIMDQTSNTQAQVSLTERNAAKQPLGRQKKWPDHFSENINIFFPRPTPKTHRGNGPNRQALPVHWTCMAHENAGFLTHKWTVHPWMVASHSAFGKSSIIYRWLRNEIHKTSFEMHQDVSCTASNHPFDLYQSFPTPIRALPGSRRTFVLCRFPPVEDTPRYSCLERANSLFGSFIGVILISLASPKRVGSLVWLILALFGRCMVWRLITICKLECGISERLMPRLYFEASKRQRNC